VTLLTVYLFVAGLAGAAALWMPVRLPVRWWLLALAALPQLPALVGVRHSGLSLLSLGLCLAWAWANRGLPGLRLLTLGLGLNLLVMALHGGSMPISTDRLADLGVALPAGSVLLGAKDVAVAGSPIWWLGDWMTVRYSPYALTASPGDLLVLAGLARWLLAARPMRSHLHDPSSAELLGSLPASGTPER